MNYEIDLCGRKSGAENDWKFYIYFIDSGFKRCYNIIEVRCIGRRRKMNILFFLTPKAEVACVDEDSTLRQALEKLENSGFSALPIISKQGKYIGTITEGDMLWYIKNNAYLNLFEAEDIPLQKVKRKRDNKAVSISENIDSLWEKVMNQNFVPVVDDDNVFIGIVTRRDLMGHIVKEYKNRSVQVTA